MAIAFKGQDMPAEVVGEPVAEDMDLPRSRDEPQRIMIVIDPAIATASPRPHTTSHSAPFAAPMALAPMIL